MPGENQEQAPEAGKADNSSTGEEPAKPKPRKRKAARIPGQAVVNSPLKNVPDPGSFPAKAPFAKKGKKKRKNRKFPNHPDAYIYPPGLDPPPRSMADLEELIGYSFRDRRLLIEAITHSSAAFNFMPPVTNNQRLEFLGDAVLGLIISAFLFSSYPEADEGSLTKSRAHLVNRDFLYERALRLELGEYLIMSRSEELNGGRLRQTALVDAFEALIGAIHLDGGFYRAEEFLELAYEDVFDTDTMPMQHNPKGELQEFLQRYISFEPPRYEMLGTDGPEHDMTFICQVTHCGGEICQGVGRTKKAAEMNAAENALALLREKYAEQIKNGMRATAPDVPAGNDPATGSAGSMAEAEGDEHDTPDAERPMDEDEDKDENAGTDGPAAGDSNPGDDGNEIEENSPRS